MERKQERNERMKEKGREGKWKIGKDGERGKIWTVGEERVKRNE